MERRDEGSVLMFGHDLSTVAEEVDGQRTVQGVDLAPCIKRGGAGGALVMDLSDLRDMPLQSSAGAGVAAPPMDAAEVCTRLKRERSATRGERVLRCGGRSRERQREERDGDAPEDAEPKYKKAQSERFRRGVPTEGDPACGKMQSERPAPGRSRTLGAGPAGDGRQRSPMPGSRAAGRGARQQRGNEGQPESDAGPQAERERPPAPQARPQVPCSRIGAKGVRPRSVEQQQLRRPPDAAGGDRVLSETPRRQRGATAPDGGAPADRARSAPRDRRPASASGSRGRMRNRVQTQPKIAKPAQDSDEERSGAAAVVDAQAPAASTPRAGSAADRSSSPRGDVAASLAGAAALGALAKASPGKGDSTQLVPSWSSRDSEPAPKPAYRWQIPERKDSAEPLLGLSATASDETRAGADEAQGSVLGACNRLSGGDALIDGAGGEEPPPAPADLAPQRGSQAASAREMALSPAASAASRAGSGRLSAAAADASDLEVAVNRAASGRSTALQARPLLPPCQQMIMFNHAALRRRAYASQMRRGPYFDAKAWDYYSSTGLWSEPFCDTSRDSRWRSFFTCVCPVVWPVRLYRTLHRSAPVEVQLCCGRTEVTEARSGIVTAMIFGLPSLVLALALLAWRLELATALQVGCSVVFVLWLVVAWHVWARVLGGLAEKYNLRGGRLLFCCVCPTNVRMGRHVDRAQGFEEPQVEVSVMMEMSTFMAQENAMLQQERGLAAPAG